ncbi:MAG: hypothetical protein ACXAAH_15640 [Promethearchaeota archaeon]
MNTNKALKLKEIYESKKAKRLILSQCHAANCWNPEYTWTYNVSPYRC